jgi:uncharacterized protein with GYD domain
MPLYMTQFAYTPEAWKALVKNPEDRGKVFGELVEKMGGSFISMYYCMGEYDGLVIYEAPTSPPPWRWSSPPSRPDTSGRPRRPCS